MDDSRDPKQETKDDVEDELDGPAGEEDGERREDEGDEISHAGTLANIRRKGYYSLMGGWILGGYWVDKLDTVDKCGWSGEQFGL